MVSGRIANQLKWFLVVGAISYAFNVVVLLGCVEWLGMHYVVAMVVTFVVGVTAAHFLHRRITFKSQQSYLRELGRYNIANLSQFIVFLLVMSIFIEFLHVPYLLANGLAAMLLACWSFIVHRTWTFADQTLDDD